MAYRTYIEGRLKAVKPFGKKTVAYIETEYTLPNGEPIWKDRHVHVWSNELPLISHWKTGDTVACMVWHNEFKGKDQLTLYAVSNVKVPETKDSRSNNER